MALLIAHLLRLSENSLQRDECGEDAFDNIVDLDHPFLSNIEVSWDIFELRIIKTFRFIP